MAETAGIQQFFVDALKGALDAGLATPDDVIKHVTPDVLAANLPRVLWGKLLAACLAAPRVDARLVVETIGVADLAANIPGAVMWNVITDVAVRALGKGLVAAPPPAAAGKGDAKNEPKSNAKADAKSEAKSDAKGEAKNDAKADAKNDAKADDKHDEPKPTAHVVEDRPRTASGQWAAAGDAVNKAAPKLGEAAAEKPQDKPGDKPADKPGDRSAPIAAKFPVTRPQTSPGIPTPAANTGSGSNRASTVTTTVTTNPAPLPQAMVVDIDFEDDDDDEPAPLEAPPARPSGTALGTPSRGTDPRAAGAAVDPRANNGARPLTGAGASSRRPQASTGPQRAQPRTTPPSPRRGGAASSDFDLDTDVSGSKDIEVPVDDDQLVDWATSEETVAGSDTDRKR